MDGRVVDAATVAASYGTSYGQANYDPYADLTMHGKVDLLDAATVAINYDQTY